jgi:sirohydrochlorin ferrochelatase
MVEKTKRQENSLLKPRVTQDAVILLGHGSRVPEAGKSMEKVAVGLKRKYGYAIVEVCYLSRLGPHFPEIFDKCVKQGADCVVIIPYFLHEGLHIVLDIPSMIQKTAARFPDVRVVLGKNLGFDDVLVDLVEKRIVDSRQNCDVREIALPSKNEYPVPEGQCEFVPMPPEEAAKYIGFNEDDHC